MLTNRRVYCLYPTKFRAQMKLAKDMRELTRKECSKDFRILTAGYGPFGTIVFEFDYESNTDMKAFSDVWYPMLEERNLITQWFESVQSGQNELWMVEEPTQETGTLAHRFTFQLTPGSFRKQWELAKELQDLTQNRCKQSMRIITALYGPKQTIVLEFIHADEQALDDFSNVWYPMIEENGIQAKWWQNVHEAKNELWVINE
jgi:hypothetical protein